MNNSTLRLVFAGTPDFAAEHLQALLQVNKGFLEIVGVYTQPDRPKGRGKTLSPSPVKALAQQHLLPIFQPASLDSPEAQNELKGLKPDIMVVVAYGLLLPEAILGTPTFGCLNVHASLLPRWRGAAPIERAIIAGDAATGTTIMQMDSGLDTGDILLTRSTPIDTNDNSESVTKRLIALGCESLLDALQQVRLGTLIAHPQDEEQSCYAKKLTKEESRINWHSHAQAIKRQVMALYPRSPAFTGIDGTRLRILDAEVANIQNSISDPVGTILSIEDKGLIVQCHEGTLLISKVQLAGKKPVSITELLNSKRELFAPGLTLDSDYV